MGLYNFQKRFVAAIQAGTKKHTIRAKRKRPERIGDMMHLYTGLRTKQAQLVLRSPCVKVEEIDIYVSCGCLDESGGCVHLPIVRIEDQELDETEVERLAKADGFDSFKAMAEFWNGRLPFEGHVIHWK